MAEIYPHLTREWLNDRKVLRYSAGSVSSNLIMHWSDDVLAHLSDNRHHSAVYLMYDISAPKASMTYLVLTNRNMLHPGITDTGKASLERFLRQTPHMHIYLAVVVSGTASGRIAQRYNMDDTERLGQVTGKIFFDEEAARAWLTDLQDRAQRTTNPRPLRQELRERLQGYYLDDPVEKFGQPDRIRMMIEGSEVSLPMPPTRTLVIGRVSENSGKRAEINLTTYENSVSVSRQHARIDLRGEQLYITDLNSTNGTYVSGREIPPGVPTMIQKNDVIKVGRITLKILFD